MYIDPDHNFKYRDPYWLMCNPIKKLQHYAYLYYLKIYFK